MTEQIALHDDKNIEFMAQILSSRPLLAIGSSNGCRQIQSNLRFFLVSKSQKLLGATSYTRQLCF